MVGGKGGRPPGLPKTGGRKAGTPNPSSLLVRQRLEELGCDPIQVLANIALNDENSQTRRGAANDLMAYSFPKLKPIELLETSEEVPEIKTIIETDPKDSPGNDDED